MAALADIPTLTRDYVYIMHALQHTATHTHAPQQQEAQTCTAWVHCDGGTCWSIRVARVATKSCMLTMAGVSKTTT